MHLKYKFLNQQILTTLGILSAVYVIFDAITTHTWVLLFSSLVYSNVVVSLICSQIILHRYFSHRSFEVNTVLHKILIGLSILPGQGSPIGWAAAHRHHHKYSDKELDNHSPSESYFLAAGGWLLKGYDWVIVKKKLKTIPTDLLRDKLIVALDSNYYRMWYLIIILVALLDIRILLYFLLAPIGFSLLIASFVTLGCHIKLPGSYKSYDTNDNTHNNMYIQFFVLGDALHNNHHYDSSKWNLKFKNNEIDPAAIIINMIRKK